MALSDSDSDDFELVDSLDVAREIVSHKKPDLTKIREWLSPTDFTAKSSEYKRHLASQAPGTGEWIRQTEHFKRWHSSDDRGSIWIKAVAGAGKSVVAASMVDSLAAQEDVPVLHFFFRQIIETNRSARSLVRDWLAQLLPFSEVLQIALWDRLDKETLDTTSIEQLWKYLRSALQSITRVYCVVDALDEMDFDEDFLSELNALGSFRPKQVKVMMTSRPKQYLQRALRDPQVIHVSLEEELVKRDIAVYVDHRVFDMESIDRDAQQFVCATICSRSQGLFLYARLMLDQVAHSISQDRPDESSVRDMVAKLPTGLEEMYNRMLSDHADLSGTSTDIQVVILQFVTQSARPLRLIEIAKALEARYSDLPGESKDIVRTSCGPLLEIMEDEVVQILHHSFTEFLLDDSRLGSDSGQFPVINPLGAHHNIALTCLARLEGGVFDGYPLHAKSDPFELSRGPRSSFDFRSVFVRYPLVEYACKNWHYHARNCQQDQKLFAALERFCDPTKAYFHAWAEFAGKNESSHISPDTTALHAAAEFGLTAWAKYLIQLGAGLDQRDGTESTPMYGAAKSNSPDIIQDLIKAGAQTDLDRYDGLKPLHAAACRDHADVVRLLVEAGVDPLTPKTKDVGRFRGYPSTTIGHSPLRYATKAGHTNSVVAMLPYVSNPEDLADALCWAAQGGHYNTLNAILQKPAAPPNGRLKVRCESVSLITGEETALIHAASALSVDCVKTLLERGADARAVLRRESIRSVRRGHLVNGETALHALARARIDKQSLPAAKKILAMLLAAGGDLEARNDSKSTPLLCTTAGNKSSKDSLTAMELFVDAGADAFAADDSGDTLLHKACCSSSDLDVARRLLELQVSPSIARPSDGATTLHASMSNTYCSAELAKLLVGFGADINARDLKGNTPLILLCKSTSSQPKQTIKALLELGADVNAQNEFGETALHLFTLRSESYNSNEQEMTDIIKNGAELEICDREGHTVLLKAVLKSKENMVEALLAAGSCSISPRTYRQGKSALHLACHVRSPVTMIKTLVKHGADPKWLDNEGNTLLHEVAQIFEGYSKDTELVETLIGLGVPLDAKNRLRRTPLHIVPQPESDSEYSSDGDSEYSSERRSRHTMPTRLLTHNPTLDINIKDIDGLTPLHLAAAASEAQTFSLIKAGADLSARSFDLRTPLHCAAKGRKSGIIAMILHHAAEHTTNPCLDINALDASGRTPLHEACRSGRPESVKILIEAGADVNKAGPDTARPLLACAEFVEENSIWISLKNGTASADEFRPIHRVAQQYRANSEAEIHSRTARIGVIASLLLAAGAAADDLNGALQAAVQAQCAELVYVLRKHLDRQSTGFAEVRLMLQTDDARKILASYQRNGPSQNLSAWVDKVDDATLDAVLEQRAGGVKSQAGDLRSAMTTLTSLGLVEKMRKVLDHTDLPIDDTKATDPTKIRPLLHVACEQPLYNMEMLKLLVHKAKADVNEHQMVKEPTKYQETKNLVPGQAALHVLAQGNYWWQIEAIKYLVENGAHVDSLDENSATPLDIACAHSRYNSGIGHGFFKPQCCDMLLHLGANPNRINKDGLVPLNHAGPDVDVIRVLLKHAADVNLGSKGVLMSAVEAGNVETLRLYLENGADCNVADFSTASIYDSWSHTSISSRYPLLRASLPAEYGGYDSGTALRMVELFLKHGADVSVPVNEEDLLIHYVFRHAPTSILNPFLTRPDINVNIKNSAGRTVLMSACQSNISYEVQYTLRFAPQAEKRRLCEDYTPAYQALIESSLHGKRIDHSAVDNEGKHLIHYLLPHWSDKIEQIFLSITEVRKLVLQKDHAGFSPLHNALKALKLQPCKTFIERFGADIVEADPNGDTALHHIFRSRYTSSVGQYKDVMAWYLESGGDIDARNNLGQTALHVHFTSTQSVPCGYGSKPKSIEDFDAIEFFLSNNANIRAVTNAGETVLHVIARRDKNSSHLYVEEADLVEKTNAYSFKQMLDLGCDVLQEDHDGRTALDNAAVVGNECILKLYQRKK